MIRSSMLVVVMAALAGCGPMEPEEEVIDEGGDLATTEDALGGRPIMRMPFRCGQVWTATTFSSHSPQFAVDWNRPGDLGDAVVASAAGTVTRSESEGNVSYGNWIEIAHANGYRTRYAHLSKRGVGVGARVRMGEKIGEVGNTGGSSGPHLHYEQLLNGSDIRVKLGASTHIVYFTTRSYRSGNGCP